MTASRKHRESDREDRLREAEGATAALENQGVKVNRQLSLVDRLSEGWRRVHERNHLAQIFHEQGGI